MTLHNLLKLRSDEEIIDWVTSIVRRVSHSSIKGLEDELISTGLLELVKIYKNSVMPRSDTFKIYSYIRVKGAILDLIRKECNQFKNVKSNQFLDYYDDLFFHYSKAYHPECALFSKEANKQIKCALKNIPEKYRLIIENVYLYDQKVANHLSNYTISCISKYKTKALKKLKANELLREELHHMNGY